MLKVGRGGGSTSVVLLRVCRGGKTLSCHFRWFKIIFFCKNSPLELPPNSRIRCRLEKGVDCAIFHDFRGPFRVWPIFLGSNFSFHWFWKSRLVQIKALGPNLHISVIKSTIKGCAGSLYHNHQNSCLCLSVTVGQNFNYSNLKQLRTKCIYIICDHYKRHHKSGPQHVKFTSLRRNIDLLRGANSNQCTGLSILWTCVLQRFGSLEGQITEESHQVWVPYLCRVFFWPCPGLDLTLRVHSTWGM